MPELSRTRSSSEPIDSASASLLGEQHRPRVDAVALGEDELQEQQRAALADVLDRLRQPFGDRGVAGRGRAEDRPVRAARARLVPGRDDQPALLEDLERAVDERAGRATRSSRARRSGESCLANAQPCAGRSQSRASTAHSPGARSRSLTIRNYGGEPAQSVFRPGDGTWPSRGEVRRRLRGRRRAARRASLVTSRDRVLPWCAAADRA